MSETSYKAMLSLRVIEQHFGDVTAHVASQLVAHPASSLRSLIQYIRLHSHTSPATHVYSKLYARSMPSMMLNVEMIRKALIILQQQNCLQMSQLNNEHDEAKPLLYSLDMDMVINRLRFPKFIQISYQKHGKIGELIMEEVLLHGRVQLRILKGDVAERLFQLEEKKTIGNESSEYHMASSSNNGNKGIQSKEQWMNDSESQIVEIFQRMVEARLLVKVNTIKRSTKMTTVEVLKGSMDQVFVGSKRKSSGSQQGGRGRGQGRQSTAIGLTDMDHCSADDSLSVEDTLFMAGVPNNFNN